jgi:hypothetical protein
MMESQTKPARQSGAAEVGYGDERLPATRSPIVGQPRCAVPAWHRLAAAEVGAVSAGTCPNCGKDHPYLLPLHGDRGGPLFCPLCAGEWNARHSRRRKFGRVVIKAIQLYLANGGSFSDIRKMEGAVAMAQLGFKAETAHFRADEIGSEVGDITSELLADTLQLTHPDRHPPERKEMAQRVTQELLALKPFVFPAPKPKPAQPVTPRRNGSEGSRQETPQKPSQPAYPCELCAGSIPYFYCTPCKAEYQRRREAEREAGRAKRRKQAERRRERKRMMTRPIPCPGCGDPFKPSRKDARYCSNVCRQRAHRERNAALQVSKCPAAGTSKAVTAGAAP